MTSEKTEDRDTQRSTEFLESSNEEPRGRTEAIPAAEPHPVTSYSGESPFGYGWGV